MTKPIDVFANVHVQKALKQLIKEVVEVAQKHGDDLNFLTLALGLKGGNITVSRGGCRCINCAGFAAQAIMADAVDDHRAADRTSMAVH